MSGPDQHALAEAKAEIDRLSKALTEMGVRRCGAGADSLPSPPGPTPQMAESPKPEARVAQLSCSGRRGTHIAALQETVGVALGQPSPRARGSHQS